MLSNSIQKKITEANNKIWQDRLVGIHRRDHTLRKNQNRPTIKNHAELLSCQIIHSSTYTYRQPNCIPSNWHFPFKYSLSTYIPNHRRLTIQLSPDYAIAANKKRHNTTMHDKTGWLEHVCQTLQRTKDKSAHSDDDRHKHKNKTSKRSKIRSQHHPGHSTAETIWREK